MAAGLGAEWAFAQNWSVKLEYLYDPYRHRSQVLGVIRRTVCPPYCRIWECYPGGAIADGDPMAID